MKHIFSVTRAALLFTVCFTLCLLLAACGGQEQPSETTPAETPSGETISAEAVPTQPQETTAPTLPEQPEEASIYHEPEYGQIPMLFSFPGETEDLMDFYFLTWDVENGCFSDPQYWLTQKYESFFDTQPTYWTGGAFLETLTDWISSQPGIEGGHKQGSYETYGKAVAIDRTVQVLDEHGDAKEIPLPSSVPYDEYGQKTPFYATVDGDTAVIAYRTFDNESGADVQYGTFPLENPDAIQWKSLHIPDEEASYFAANSPAAAYSNGVLYLATGTSVFAVELESGEMERVSAIDAVYSLYPNTRQWEDSALGGSFEPIMLKGAWKDTLVAQLDLYDLDGDGSRILYIALQDGEVAGVLVRENNAFTFLNKDLEVVGTDDTYQDALLLTGVAWAKDD